MSTSTYPLLASVGALLLASCGGPTPDPMASKHADMMKADSAAKAMVAAQEATARSVFEMFNTGNTEGLEEWVSADFIDHQQPPEVTSTG